jgi:mxaJ protein
LIIPALHNLRIGVQIMADEGINPPPAQALGRRGMINTPVGFSIYGDYSEANPPARIVEAVARGDVDVAVVRGPLAGYFARRQAVPLMLIPVAPANDPPWRFTFGIAMGVRKHDAQLRDAINTILVRRQTDIENILDQYGVPRLPAPATRPAA